MKIRVHLRDTRTGIAGVYETDWDHSLEGLTYQYGDGNYSCDCNRSCFLADANPAFDDAVDEEILCNGGPNRIAIDIIEDTDGRVLYRDDPT